MVCLRGRGTTAVQQSAQRGFGGWQLAIVLVLTFAHARSVWATPPDRRGVDDDVTALVRLGDRSRLEGRFAEAEASYRAALARRQDDATALGLALALAAQGKAREAAPWLSKLSTASTLSDDARDEAARALSDAKRELATIELRASLHGASMDVDGAPAGVSPLAGAVFLDPGVHTFRASLGGFLTAQASLDTAAGHAYVVDLELLPDPATQARWPSGAGSVRRAPPASDPSFADYFLAPGGPVRAFGLGLALTMGIGGAAALGIASENDHLIADYKRAVSLRQGPSCFDTKPASDLDCQRLAQSMSASKNGNTAGAVLLGGAGVAAAVALLSLFLLPPPSLQAGRAANPRSILTLTPTAGLSFGGLSLEATW